MFWYCISAVLAETDEVDWRKIKKLGADCGWLGWCFFFLAWRSDNRCVLLWPPSQHSHTRRHFSNTLSVCVCVCSWAGRRAPMMPCAWWGNVGGNGGINGFDAPETFIHLIAKGACLMSGDSGRTQRESVRASIKMAASIASSAHHSVCFLNTTWIRSSPVSAGFSTNHRLQLSRRRYFCVVFAVVLW